LANFVETAIQVLKTGNPNSITESVVRVDVFQRNDGKMVVNEFESLEAGIWSKKLLTPEENLIKSETVVF
jgi:hypothetical protein